MRQRRWSGRGVIKLRRSRWKGIMHEISCTLDCTMLGVMVGAAGRNRTGTPLRARDFKSLVSTYFTTAAQWPAILALGDMTAPVT